MDLDQALTSELQELKEKGLYRSLRRLQIPGSGGESLSSPLPPYPPAPQLPSPTGSQPPFRAGPRIVWEGRELLLLSSNSYLGLHDHPVLIEAACQALHRYGTGAGASRLISGNLDLHEELEEEIARFKRTEAALLFSTGYQANLGAITSLVNGPQDLVLSDELNHASIVDACRLSGATRRVYPHKDTDRLEAWLAEGRSYRRRLIVTDGVFSMDGDLAPLPELCLLAEKYGAVLLIDDAHGFGVLGQEGRGSLEHFGLEGRVPIQIGTLSKALANLGGYVAGSRTLIDYLRNRARSFIYSTALPPSVLASSLAALRLVGSKEGAERRKALWKNVRHLGEGLSRLNFCLPESETHILPLLVGEANLTLQLAEGLLQKGVFAPAIRPPTVPQNKCRLRLSLMATHTQSQMDQALEALESVGRALGLTGRDMGSGKISVKN